MKPCVQKLKHFRPNFPEFTMLASWQNILFCFHKLVATHLKNPAPFHHSQDLWFLWKTQSNPRDALGEQQAFYIQPLVPQKLSEYRIRITNTQNDKQRISTYNPPSHLYRYRVSIFNDYNGQNNGRNYEFEFCRRPPPISIPLRAH